MDSQHRKLTHFEIAKDFGILLLKIGGVCLAIGLLAIGILFAFSYTQYRTGLPREVSFDALVWKANTKLFVVGKDHPRRGMVMPLKERLERERPSRRQVLELLGLPDVQFRTLPNTLGYAVGCGFTAPCFLDDDFLAVEFLKDGTFKSAFFVQD